MIKGAVRPAPPITAGVVVDAVERPRKCVVCKEQEFRDTRGVQVGRLLGLR